MRRGREPQARPAQGERTLETAAAKKRRTLASTAGRQLAGEAGHETCGKLAPGGGSAAALSAGQPLVGTLYGRP